MSARAGFAAMRLPNVRFERAILAIAVAGAAAAGVAAYSVVRGDTLVAVAIALVPVLLWEVSRLTASLVALGAAIPALNSVAGGRTSLEISAADLLLVFITGGILLRALVTQSAPAIRALRPVALPVAQYSFAMLVLLGIHWSGGVFTETAQRLVLLVLPLVVGAFAVLTGRHVRLLQAYVLASTLLAVVWQINDFGMQKNPVGQLVGNAILLIVAVRPLRPLLPCIAILLPGLLLTQSRGAVVATAIGLGVVALVQGPRSRLLLARTLPVVFLGAIAFILMPQGVQDRLTTFSSRSYTNENYPTSAQYAIRIREKYAEDAQRIIDQHPLTGIGVGNYATATASSEVHSEDPHHVLLLQAAEGGYGFAASFVGLIVGAIFVLWRLRYTQFAAAAVAVVTATAAHGLVDVYWVRGTPVLGWLLIGMTCGAFAQQRGAT